MPRKIGAWYASPFRWRRRTIAHLYRAPWLACLRSHHTYRLLRAYIALRTDTILHTHCDIDDTPRSR